MLDPSGVSPSGSCMWWAPLLVLVVVLLCARSQRRFAQRIVHVVGATAEHFLVLGMSLTSMMLSCHPLMTLLTSVKHIYMYIYIFIYWNVLRRLLDF